MEKTYRSKVDAWLIAVLGFAFVTMAGVMVLSLWASGDATAVIPLVLFSLMLGAVAFPTQYTLTKDLLRVQSGLLRYRIPLAEITEVTPTREPWSSPALSLDRLNIAYGNGKRILISPAEKTEFVSELNVRIQRTRSR
ncbi:MAG: PH domain-containing protein [Fimbriimonadaceae bacterium]|nr:PH domain-containing protein [Fimbriimonadaceae bacterium]